MGRGGMGMMGADAGKSMMCAAVMARKYRDLTARLDLMEARMAKMETMLERLIQL